MFNVLLHYTYFRSRKQPIILIIGIPSDHLQFVRLFDVQSKNKNNSSSLYRLRMNLNFDVMFFEKHRILINWFVYIFQTCVLLYTCLQIKDSALGRIQRKTALLQKLRNVIGATFKSAPRASPFKVCCKLNHLDLHWSISRRIYVSETVNMFNERDVVFLQLFQYMNFSLCKVA